MKYTKSRFDLYCLYHLCTDIDHADEMVYYSAYYPIIMQHLDSLAECYACFHSYCLFTSGVLNCYYLVDNDVVLRSIDLLTGMENNLSIDYSYSSQ